MATKIERVHPTVVRMTSGAREIAALISAARWVAAGCPGHLPHEAVDQLRQVLADCDAGDPADMALPLRTSGREDGAMSATLGEAFALAVAAKDHDRVRALLHHELDFRAMTPGRVWDAHSADDVIDVLRAWFEDDDHIEGVDALDTDCFADRARVGYRLRVRNRAGLHLVEQQAYLSARDGTIGWLRIMCSGFRPTS